MVDVMTRGRKAALSRAINRFQRAVEEHALKGTIPFDCEAGIAAREEVETEFVRSRECLVQLVERYTEKTRGG